MINFNTILSSYDERGTLLKWLKSLQAALEGGALSTVTTTTGDDYVIFHFNFADGTSVNSPSIPLEAGPQGPQGDPGPQGAPGVDGEDGAAATVEIGTVTTLAPGADATVTNSGTSAAAVLNFGIPQGATGDPGEIIEQIVPVEATTTASRAYAVGDYFVNNLGILVQATAAIALGATIDSTNSTAVNETLSKALNKKWALRTYSLIVQTTLTNTPTSYATYNGRLISDYMLLLIEFKNSTNDIRDTAIVSSSYTGATTLECLHGSTGGSLTGYQRATLNVQKMDDTHFQLSIGGSENIKMIEILGIKVEEI